MLSENLTMQDFTGRLTEIKDSTPIIYDETEKAGRIRIEKLLDDYAAFFEFYFPMYATAKCAWFHVWVANMLLKNKSIRFILEWFRGCAKSVHADVGYPLFLKAHKQLKCMVLVGQTAEKACILMSDLQAQLQSNQRYIHDYGEQYSHGNWKNGHFKTKDGCSFHALGFGQSPRGLRNAGNRPDYIVIDDIDTQEMSNNQSRVRKGVDWVSDDLMGCFDIGTQRFINANNQPFANSILGGLVNEKLKGGITTSVQQLNENVSAEGAFHYQHRRHWHHLRVNAIDGEHNPSWPEKYTKEYWYDVRDDRTLRSWMREYMNTPITEGSIFKNEWIKWKPILPLNEYDYLIVYADPSWKNNVHSDYKAVKFWGKRGKELHLIKSFVQQTSIAGMVKYMYDLYESTDYKRKDRTYRFALNGSAVVDFWIEANQNQDLHLEDFLEEGELRGYQLPIRPDKRNKPDKFSRIESLSPLYERGFVYYNEAEKDEPDMMRAVEQLLAFEQGSKSPDDSPDADEGAIYYMQRITRANSYKPRLGTRESGGDW